MEDVELVSTSSGESLILHDLLHCLENSEIERFQNLLEHNSNLNLDHSFGDPYYGTLLDIICMKQLSYSFIESLVSHGANPNIVNKYRKAAPLHLAVRNCDFLSVKSLLDCKKTDINILDATGSSAVHYAVQLPDLNIFELLLQCGKIDLNLVNKKGSTPLMCALKVETPNLGCIQSLLSHPNMNLYDDPKFSLIQDQLNKLIPDWESYVTKGSKSSEISFSSAFNILDNRNCDDFISILRKKKYDSAFLEGNNGSHTFLQYCCEYGLSDVVLELLDVGASPKTTCDTLARSPLMIAAYKGYATIVKMLLKTSKCSFDPIDKETVLHCAVRGSFEQKSNDECVDHLLCLNLLLAEPRNDIINEGDYKGNTALHYAAKQGENEMILSLLKAGASLSCFNSLNEPAFAFINHKILKKHLDSCINDNNKLPCDEKYKISLNYRCLKPVDNNCDETYNKHIESHYNSESLTGGISCNTFESKPLLYMAQNSELKHLLKHPLFTSFLYLKWCRIKRMFFLNLAFYFSFIVLLAYYIINDYQNVIKNSMVLKNWLWYLLIIFLTILVFRELAQFVISPLKYLGSIENYLEIAIIYLVTKILCFAEGTTYDDKVKYSVICIMLSWGELVLLFGRHHACSTYMEMLKTVSWNFLKFLGWYSFLIIAFSLSFYVLFGLDNCSIPNNSKNECSLEKKNETDNNLFSNPLVSLFKTTIMLTGEFDASSVPFVNYPGLSHVLFIAFLFFIAIVLFNLLNGMAISDTQAIQSDSELVSYISRVKLLAFIETLVSNPISNKRNNFNIFSCWEKSFINTYLKNKLLPKCINLFQEGYISDEYEIEILPFYGNQVQMGNATYSLNRKEDEHKSKCCRSSQFVKMDSDIIRAVKDVLLEKHIEEKIKDGERKKQENDQEWMSMIKYCQTTITELKKIVHQNKIVLDKLAYKEGIS